MLTKFISIFIIFSNVAFSCAVCYGNPEDLMTIGMNMGVLTLIFFIGFVLCVIAFSIVSLSIRTKKINNL